MPETKQLFSSPRCQHVHFNGKVCKAPARRGRNFCVFHQAAHFDSGGCTLPVIEDAHSYQVAIIRILRALAEDVIDSKKATALLYGLQLVGSKLDRFVEEREHVENPSATLKNEVLARHLAERNMKRTFDGIPAADLRRILADLAEETENSHDYHPERSERPVHSVPLNSQRDVISSEVAAATESRNLHRSQTSNQQPITNNGPGIISDIHACLDAPAIAPHRAQRTAFSIMSRDMACGPSNSW